MHPFDLRSSLYNRLLQTATSGALPTHRVQPKPDDGHDVIGRRSGSQTPVHRDHNEVTSSNAAGTDATSAGLTQSRDLHVSVSPSLADRRRKDTKQEPIRAPITDNMIVDEFQRVFAAFPHGLYPISPAGPRLSTHEGHEDAAAQGHDAPSWSRTTSASVLLACTALYAAIAGSATTNERQIIITHIPHRNSR